MSEAHVAKMLEIPFVAVVPRSTSTSKIALIEAAGGRCHYVDHAEQMAAESQRLADEQGGLFMDQFTHAERATDWRGNNSIAVSALDQLELEPHPVPRWIVVGAGTGGTSATFGRLLKVSQPAHRAVRRRCRELGVLRGLGAERPHGDHGPRLPDRGDRPPPGRAELHARGGGSDDPGARCRVGRRLPLSVGAPGRRGRCLDRNQPGGGRAAITQMRDRGQSGSVLTLLCDSGDRYEDTYFDDGWVAAQGGRGPLAGRARAGNLPLGGA